jgi:hypothetical protein
VSRIAARQLRELRMLRPKRLLTVVSLVPRPNMPTRTCLKLLLCLGHYATYSLDQRRIAIDAPRFQEMANFHHQPLNLRIATG